MELIISQDVLRGVFSCKLHTILTLLQKKYNISRTLHLLVQFVSYIVLRIFKDYYIYG